MHPPSADHNKGRSPPLLSLASSACPPRQPLPADGAMRLARREQEVRVSDHQCSPAQFVLRPGGRVVISVQSGPQQSFSVGRDVEEAFVTPAIPAGGAYQWCAHCRCSTAPPLLGRIYPYFS